MTIFPFALRVRDYRRLVEQPNTEDKKEEHKTRIICTTGDLSFYFINSSLFSTGSQIDRFEWSKKQGLPLDQHLCVHKTHTNIQVFFREMLQREPSF